MSPLSSILLLIHTHLGSLSSLSTTTHTRAKESGGTLYCARTDWSTWREVEGKAGV